MEIIQTIGVEKTYGQGDAKVLALRGIDLTINRGEFLAIVGTSGSGKSTLLHILGGLDQPTKGEVKVHGKNIEKLNDEALTIFRRRNIGFVFQKYNLVPMLTVWENIVVPILLDGKKIDKEYISELITLLRLTDKVNSHPNELSGGQQQRVAIARALATKPVIIFADEPTGNLDSKTGQDVLGLLRITSSKFKQTMVIITHDEGVAQLADRIIRMEDGILVSEVRDG
ncbi:ABC transporter ATP-binding protein [Enterococcus raffinosus]|uniref:ABC transporter ATP-binding protein n=1 Tax=Enterococcus raffinosus TaxID=71452 RepID=UPI001C11A70A|nr:ABC transporter ATP-binding protein [Enterococcus raffinosus]MBU5360749.1 ABC transporter ATP-binding protein [Enterococcus raffinosus]